METIQKLMAQGFPQSMSLREIADSYNHVSLTEEEELEGIIWAKQRKEVMIADKARKEREAENRKYLTGGQWNTSQTDAFMMYRIGDRFKGRFTLDDDNTAMYQLLCMYFSHDPAFVLKAAEMGVVNPSLLKGIMITGNTGNGKTTFMQLFSKNQRQIFYVRSAKDLANIFEKDGEEAITEYVEKFPLLPNDSSTFYQMHAGLCIDDIGTEEVKNHFGNKKNVIGEIIERRYSSGNTGIVLHATTNLSGDQIEQMYGLRLRSRMREIFNFIELTGKDRRK